MRLLVSCPSCKRQYDAGKLPYGAHFRCLCGGILQVPRPRPHDADVVRCSSCGGPRQGRASACSFCGADFSLHERDLHTICPECMARVSDRARFCHHCASPLLPVGAAGEPTARPCPACGEGRFLNSRRLGEPAISVLECPVCAGLWLGTDELRLVLERARAAEAPPETTSLPAPASGRPLGSSRQAPLYRPCPVCTQLMHRRNYGRRSGVIVDSCASHGLWFDAQELDGIIHWVRRGGETQVKEQQEDEKREAARQTRLKRRMEPTEPDWRTSRAGPESLVDLLAWLAEAILGR